MPEKNRFPAVLQPVVIDRAAFNQGENAQYDPHIGESDVMDTLVARGPHAVGIPSEAIPIQDGRDIEKKQNGLGVAQPGDLAYTVDTTGAQGIGQPVGFRKSKRAQSETDDETGVADGKANTLNNFDLGDTRTTHAVVHCSDVAPTVTSSGPPFSRTGNERVECDAIIVQASELRLTGKITEQTVCPTLKANTKGGDTEPLTVQPIAFSAKDNGATHAVVQQVYENHPNDYRVTGPHDVCPTIISRYGTGGGNVPLVNPEPIAFQPGNLRREAGADPSTEAFPTLKSSAGDQSPHVAHPVVPLDGMNLLSRLGECGEKHSMQDFTPGDPSFTLKKGGTQHGVLTPMAVRRLTPLECERLQGFPDNHTLIPWRGKPASECPDGPRYKAIGNSWAVPCAKYIGERINMVEEIKDEKAQA